jgi:class 3 adenylate cyclase
MRDLDPEEARAIVDPVLHLMMAAVHRYGGYVAQSTGDGIFALFDAPLAHEDHPQRALHAALAMQEELRRYADRLRFTSLRHSFRLSESSVASVPSGWSPSSVKKASWAPAREARANAGYKP